jgi:hypothetical protein
MSEGPTAAGAARRVGSGTTRLVRAWKALPNESRLAAYASGALFLTLFLPWYQVTLIAPEKAKGLESASASITGWGAFSFVEAAVLLVVVAVLTLLFQRAEGRAFHLPGGDGGVILAAGLWTCVLIVWRIFDKQGATTNGPSATTSGIEWGIFVALAAAAFLAYAGSRIRAAHRPEPPLPGEDTPPVGSSASATFAADATRATHGRVAGAAAGEAARREPTRRDAARREPTGTRRPVPPRRRPVTAPAVAPDRPAHQERSARPTGVPASGAAPASATDRPRRRPTADELFERVVPDDPPTMPFGRAKPADTDATLRMASTRPPNIRPDPPSASREPADPAPPDEQRTMPLGNDDDTLRLDRD